MPTRRTGVLTALLLTAALFLAMPGVWRGALERDPSRMHPSLRPAQMRTLTVWLIPGDTGDRKLLSQCCAAFEKSHRGARVFLRAVTADELYGEGAVLPDVLLFSTGDVLSPEGALLPLTLDMEDSSGRFGGVRYAAPLWYQPRALCYPESWGDDPWPVLAAQQAITLPEGTALQQLMMTCPEGLRSSFTDASLGRLMTPTPSAPMDGVPPSRGASPTPAPTVRLLARVDAAPKEGERELALSPAVSDCVRYAALCRDGGDAQAFLQFLLQYDPSAHGFVTVHSTPSVLPNAFLHTREEIRQLCLGGFARGDDPALTLMSLR